MCVIERNRPSNHLEDFVKLKQFCKTVLYKTVQVTKLRKVCNHILDSTHPVYLYFQESNHVIFGTRLFNVDSSFGNFKSSYKAAVLLFIARQYLRNHTVVEIIAFSSWRKICSWFFYLSLWAKVFTTHLSIQYGLVGLEWKAMSFWNQQKHPKWRPRPNQSSKGKYTGTWLDDFQGFLVTSHSCEVLQTFF